MLLYFLIHRNVSCVVTLRKHYQSNDELLHRQKKGSINTLFFFLILLLISLTALEPSNSSDLVQANQKLGVNTLGGE